MSWLEALRMMNHRQEPDDGMGGFKYGPFYQLWMQRQQQAQHPWEGKNPGHIPTPWTGSPGGPDVGTPWTGQPQPIQHVPTPWTGAPQPIGQPPMYRPPEPPPMKAQPPMSQPFAQRRPPLIIKR